MKWFWFTLVGFCLLMCSCKSKKLAHEIAFGSKIASEVNSLSKKAKIDTTKTIHSEQLSENKHVVETLIITEYDEKGNVYKKTERKREVKQDSDKAIETIQAVGIEEMSKDSLNHIADVRKKVESGIKEESDGGQDAFGKWLGIVIGIAVSILFVYLLKKFRVN